MPQLDIILWFSQIVWAAFFFVSVFAFIRLFYIPFLAFLSGSSQLKQEKHQESVYFFNLKHFINTQHFWLSFSRFN